MRSLLSYLGQSAWVACRHPRSLHLATLVRNYGLWRDSLRDGRTPLDDGVPWFTFDAIRFLEARLHARMVVFEYGVGGSTLFLGRRVGRLVSVEHDPKWAVAVAEAVALAGLSNWQLQVQEPASVSGDEGRDDPADFTSYRSSDSSLSRSSFVPYASAIDPFPDHCFDIVVIDGRARPSCFAHSVSKVKPHGLLVLDNAERAHYREIHRYLARERWTHHRFCGPGPCGKQFWCTSIYVHSSSRNCRPPRSAQGAGPLAAAPSGVSR